MIMKKLHLYLLCIALLGSACQKEGIIEPELSRPQHPETTFSDLTLAVTHITDRSANLTMETPSEKGRYDVYLNDILISTGEVKYAQAWCDLTNLSPEQTYEVKVRWIYSDDEVKFAQTSFTTQASFLNGYGVAVAFDPYLYADYRYLSMHPVADGMVYTLRTQKDFGYQNIWVTLMKSDAEGRMQWMKDYPLYVGEDFSDYRDTKLLPDGKILLITTKRIICITADGQTVWMHEFFEPQEEKIILNDACLMDDGNVMVVGSSQREWGQNNTLWEEAYLAVIASDGKIKHETFHDILKHNRLDRIEPMSNGHYLIAGTATEDSWSFASGVFCTYTVDVSGNILDVKQYPDYQYLQTKSSLKDEEGYFYFLGKEINPIVYVDTRLSIIRLAPDGSLSNRNTYERRAGRGALEPVCISLQDGHLVILSNNNEGSNVLVTDKQGNKVHHWGLVVYPGEDKFVYAGYEDSSMTILDSYGYFHLYNLKGYKEYPYVHLKDGM